MCTVVSQSRYRLRNLHVLFAVAVLGAEVHSSNDSGSVSSPSDSDCSKTLSGVDSFPKLTHLAVVEQRRSSRWKNTTSLQTRFLKV